MTFTTPASHLIHDELSPTPEMTADCRAAGVNLQLERIARAAASTPPSIHFADYPREIAKRDIDVTDAARRLANELHLHLD